MISLSSINKVFFLIKYFKISNEDWIDAHHLKMALTCLSI